MSFVRDGKHLYPAFLFDEPVNRPPGACPRCYGSGKIRETIDEELPDEMVPCFMCMTFCKVCRAWVKKTEHECKEQR